MKPSTLDYLVCILCKGSLLFEEVESIPTSTEEGKEIIIGHCSNEDDDPISLAIFDNGLRSVKFSDRSIKIIDDVCH